ncbi:diguanylate phosphodiesterase [Burkholderia ubonensis]|uniref:EAL domain-containing protein n=1 Tax=Burkholderia ubonensis TaxID=101571 RepID=UPI000757DAAC|nr:EAL domain-containing protein [Burkholderia ubonensis]KVP56946.1 diguanylate phosphodiesterase [Burkholderia ubonensis]KVQ01094.1 diguanylate phosphodiesterase [Burkholderia ubonensis]KVV58538.1 diguanylate phosphodiesterase [Burkholderia ubonensis]KVW21325.1 diguanylate phosphodiesterase [Burkholderia ubonensis]KWB40234.1 diguanylate phosphodiesterase [Burkholderia ubonensis]
MNVVDARLEAQMQENHDDAGQLFDPTAAHPDSVAVCRFIERRLAFAREPVCRTDLSGGVLYRECLARLARGQRDVLRPVAFLPGLVSMGLMRWFDQLVVSRTIDSLRADAQAVYGCNVSASSATEDAQWQAIFDRLHVEPALAQRLVLEITETTPLDPLSGRAFVHRARQTGCRIAIDDFGAGHSAHNHFVVGRPDIVKLDRSMLAMIRNNAVGRYQVRRLVALTHENAGHVVVEGVETELDRQMSIDAGVRWAQGDHFSRRSDAA